MRFALPYRGSGVNHACTLRTVSLFLSAGGSSLKLCILSSVALLRSSVGEVWIAERCVGMIHCVKIHHASSLAPAVCIVMRISVPFAVISCKIIPVIHLKECAQTTSSCLKSMFAARHFVCICWSYAAAPFPSSASPCLLSLPRRAVNTFIIITQRGSQYRWIEIFNLRSQQFVRSVLRALVNV